MTRDEIVDVLVKAYVQPGYERYAPPNPADHSTMIIFLDTDGYNSIRALTYGEIADTLVEALELEKE